MANATSPGLTALADTSVQSLAASPESTDVLANMQKRAEQLSSPWHGLQNALDDMVAHTGYRPSAALEQRALQKSSESQELQNIGMTRAQVEQMKQQMGSMRDTFGQLSGQPQAGGSQQSQAGGSQQSQAGGQSQPNQTDISSLTPLQLKTLQTFVQRNDVAGFNGALKEFANTNAKAELESKNSWQRMDLIENAPILAPDGKIYNVTVTKEEYDRYQKNPKMLPTALGGNPTYPGPRAQGKREGGRIQHLALGGQPEPVPMAPEPYSQDPSTAPAPVGAQAAPQGSTAENIIGLLSGSGSAQAAPPQGNVTVQGWKPPEMANTQNPAFQKQGQQSGLQQEQQTNEAQLNSLKEERTAAGKFIADLENQSANPTVLQNAQEIIDMATKHPEYFGYGYKQDPIGLMMKLTGNTEDSKGEAGARESGILSGMKEFFAGEDAMSKRARLDNLAKQLGIAYEKEQFGGTGSKMGAQLTTISQSAKGLSSKFPPEQNIAQAMTVQIVHERNVELAREWDKYKTTVKNPDPYAFMHTPKIQGIVSKWNLELTDKINKVMNKPKDGTPDTDKSGNPIIWQNGQPMRVKK